jgi:hypothetical protein
LQLENKAVFLQKTKSKVFMKEDSELPTFIAGIPTNKNTYAILKLKTIVKHAAAAEGDIIYIPAKTTGNQKEHRYINLAILYYDFVEEKKPYMDFRVKLILGIKNDGRHVQYSVNKIDVVKK